MGWQDTPERMPEGQFDCESEPQERDEDEPSNLCPECGRRISDGPPLVRHKVGCPLAAVLFAIGGDL